MKNEHDRVTPYQSDETKKSQVEDMFDNIASDYDFLNHLLSFGVDILWRKRAVKELGSIEPKNIMDMASGTGDFAFEALSLNPDQIYAVDLSQEMLTIGEKKAEKRRVSDIIKFEKGDSENLKYDDAFFDAITVGFGVRNFEHLDKGLSELYRVLRPGGKLVILEPSFPKNPIMKSLFTIHFKYITPFLGRIFSKDNRAYEYLPESVEAFPSGETFTDILSDIGFQNTKYKPLSLGMCSMYVATK